MKENNINLLESKELIENNPMIFVKKHFSQMAKLHLLEQLNLKELL